LVDLCRFALKNGRLPSTKARILCCFARKAIARRRESTIVIVLLRGSISRANTYLQDENLDTYTRGRCPVAAAEPKGAILYLGTPKFQANEEMSILVVLAHWERMPGFCNAPE